MRRNRDQRDRGAVLVEFAIVGPLLLALLIGFFEVGTLVIGSAAGTNAAREGARVGILDFVAADTSGSTQQQAIVTAARQKLASLVQDQANVSVTVRCLDYDLVRSGAANPAIACTEAAVEEGRDLLEVTVRWRPLIVSGFVSPGLRTDRSRMTIVGSPDTSSGGGSPNLPTINLACSPTTITETNGTQNITCTVTRTNTSTAVTFNYATADGTAVAPSDYTATNGANAVLVANGPTSTSFTVPIVGDTVNEPTQTFTVSISGAGNAVLGTSSVTITIVDDDPADASPPTLGTVRLLDLVSPLGRIDTIRLQLSEPVVACPGGSFPGNLAVGGLPSGYSVGTTTTGGSTLDIRLNQGSANVTSVGSIQVSYSAGSLGLCDGAGNPLASFNVTPQDGAAPYLVAITTTNNGTNDRPSAGDTIRFQFTEPVTTNGTGTVVLTRGNGNNKPTSIAVTPLFVAGDLVPDTFNWFGSNNGGTATFATTIAPAGNELVVTLGACAGLCTFTENSAATITLPAFAWNTAPTDAAGNAAGNPIAPPSVAVPLTVSGMF